MAKPADTRQMIERLKELLVKATPGPWRAYVSNAEEGMPKAYGISNGNPGGAICHVWKLPEWSTRTLTADAELIAEAVNFVRDHIATIETLTPSAAGEGERAKAYTENGLDYVQYEIERVISRRVMEDRINGYTLEMAEELAAVARTALASLASPPQPHPDIEGLAREIEEGLAHAIMWHTAKGVPGDFGRLEARLPLEVTRVAAPKIIAWLREHGFAPSKALTLPCAEIRREPEMKTIGGGE